MPGQAAQITGQAGHLAAQFARKMQGRLTQPRPSAAAWETRLAIKRGIADSLPHLIGSVDRLLTESRPRATGKASSPAVGAAARQAKIPLHSEAPRDSLRHALHDFSSAQIAPFPRANRAEVHSEGDAIFTRPPAVPVAEAAQETSPRHLPPSVLRAKLIRQSGFGEDPTISLRQILQPYLKFDPAIARLHRGAAAAAAARELDAEAFTIGPDIFFAEGRYAPQTRAGLGLLAHELTHVGQQTALLGDKMRFFTPHGGDALENEAQQTAARVLASGEHEKTDRTGGTLHQTSAAPRPELAFALSPARSSGAAAAPAQKATEESGQSGAKMDPSQADARAVADRVYEIMKQEIALGRERGIARRTV